MVWLFVALIALAVVAVGLLVVGRTTTELAAQPPATVLDLDDAVVWVGDHLSDETSAQVSYGDVRSVLGWYLDYLTDKGVARDDDVDPAMSGPLMASEDEALAWVLGQMALAATADSGTHDSDVGDSDVGDSDVGDSDVGDSGTAPDLTDEQVVEICDTTRSYLVAIGAVRSIDANGPQ